MRLLAFALVVGLGLSARATTMRPISIQELSQQADVVAVGWIVARESRWVGTRIMTFATLEIEEVWQGKVVGSTLALVTLGGVVGDIGQNVPGAPRFAVGQHLAVVLKRDAQGRYAPVGLWQGVFVIENDAAEPPRLKQPTEGGSLIPGPVQLPARPQDLEGLKRAFVEAQKP